MTKKSDLVTDLLTIESIVKERLFKIPDYQRGFSWGEKQISDLISDIEHITKYDYKHFTGTIVISQPENSERFDVVDGQQRLTTLIILLNEIYLLNPTEYSNLKTDFLLRNGQYVLETNSDTKQYFKDAVLGTKTNLPKNIKSLKNLSEAKSQLKKWLSLETTSVDLVLNVVLNKLGFICFAPAVTNEIGIMFEVINNRGKDLSELEKIKNYFIYYATVHDSNVLRDKVNSNWSRILKYLSKANVVSNDDENKYLRNCFLVFFNPSKKKSWHSYEELKSRFKVDESENVEKNINEISKFIDFLEEASQYYAYFSNPDLYKIDNEEGYNKELHQALNNLRCHPVNASIFPLYLAAMVYEKNNPESVVRVLAYLEILNFRVYVLKNKKVSRADSNQGTLFYWAHFLYWNRDWTSATHEEMTTVSGRKIEGNIFDNILQRMEDFIMKICPEEVFVESLTIDEDEPTDFYKWQGLRLLLAVYERSLKASMKESWDISKILIKRKDTDQKSSNDYLSIEHIWASKNREEDFPPGFIDKRRLGNFVLLGLSRNQQLQKDDLNDKIDFLRANDSKSMTQVNELQTLVDGAERFVREERKTMPSDRNFFQELATQLIDRRETVLIQFALKEWSFDGEKLNRFEKVDSFKAKDLGKKENYFLKEKS